jgi:2OG-Fe(II) oxygenase superfamily
LPADAGQLTRTGFRSASLDHLTSLRRASVEAPCVQLSEFLEPWIHDRWSRALDAAPFKPRVHHDAAYWGGTPPNDLALDAPDLLGEMLFLMNDPALFRFVERILDCGSIGCFKGIVYRFVPGQGHGDRWHSDIDGNRLAAISVNMSRQPFAGGRLQITDAGLERLLFDRANREPGDAFLFRISDDLKHRVSDVEPGPPRTVFTGWFVRRPSYPEWLRTGHGSVDVKDV